MDIEPITPQQFQDSDGVEDWRVMYWGAHAFFRADSYGQGARFVAAVADVVSGTAHEPDVNLRREGVTVKLITRSIRGLSAQDVEVARRVSGAARSLGLRADPSVLQVLQVAVASVPSADVTPFWKAALGYVQLSETHLVDPLRRGPSFYLQDEMDEDRPRRGRFHIDVCVPDDQVEKRIAAILDAGGRMADDSYAPEWWTLADAENHGVDITTMIGRSGTRLEEGREE